MQHLRFIDNSNFVSARAVLGFSSAQDSFINEELGAALKPKYNLAGRFINIANFVSARAVLGFSLAQDSFMNEELGAALKSKYKLACGNRPPFKMRGVRAAKSCIYDIPVSAQLENKPLIIVKKKIGHHMSCRKVGLHIL